jgi:hypothetical protein
MGPDSSSAYRACRPCRAFLRSGFRRNTLRFFHEGPTVANLGRSAHGLVHSVQARKRTTRIWPLSGFQSLGRELLIKRATIVLDEWGLGTAATDTTFDRSRQVIDTGSLITILYSVLYLVIFLYLLNWFYQAVKRIEKSLQGIEKRLEAIEASPAQPTGPNQQPPSLPAPPQGAKKRETVSNMWGIPAILLIAALFSGSLGLTPYLLYAAGVMVIVAAAWEVVRREVHY